MAGSAWNSGDPKTTIGDCRWANYTVSVDVQFEAAASGQYATIGAREQGGTANGQNVSAAELKVDPTGAWTFLRFGTTVASGTVAATPTSHSRPAPESGTPRGDRRRLRLQRLDQRRADHDVHRCVAAGDRPHPARIELQLRRLRQPQGRRRSRATRPTTRSSSTACTRRAGRTARRRSCSSTAAGATSTARACSSAAHRVQEHAQGRGDDLHFTGTGLDIIGTNTGTPTLNVTVDGVQVVANAPTLARRKRAHRVQAARPEERHAHRGDLDGEREPDQRRRGRRHHRATRTRPRSTRTPSPPRSRRRRARRGRVEHRTPGPACVRCCRMLARPSPTRRPSASTPKARRRITARLTDRRSTRSCRRTSARTCATSASPPIASPDRTLPKTSSSTVEQRDVDWSASSVDTGAVDGRARHLHRDRTHDRQAPSSGVYQRFSASVVRRPGRPDVLHRLGRVGAAAASAYAAVKAAFPTCSTTRPTRSGTARPRAPRGATRPTATTLAAGTPTDWGSSYVGADFNKPSRTT